MKKILSLLILILLPLLGAQAQYARFGAKAGGGFTRAVGDDVPSDDIRHLAGLSGGFIGTYEFVSSLAAQVELNYVGKGFVYEGYNINDNEFLDGDFRLHYLELPLLAKVQKGGLFAEAGPYVAYLLKMDDRVSVMSRTEPPLVLRQQEFDISDFNRFDYGYTAGLGIMLETGFFLSVRNSGGLRSFSKDINQRNMSWQITIGYLRPARRPADRF